MTSRARVALLLGLLVLCGAPHVQSAQAQGFPQPDFGSSPPPRAYRYPALPYRYAPSGAPFSPRQFEEVPPRPFSNTYRTLCVRMCDGYYFPISSAATQDTLMHDAEARLFFLPSTGGDPGSAVDLTGMAYSALPNAFKYRKTLVEDCRCRPQPWSEAERERHRAYAQGQSPGDAGAEGAGPRNAEVIAGGDYSRRSIVPVDDGRAVPRPDPIVRNIEPILPERSLFGAGGWEMPRGYGWPYGRRY
jgi:hypothetical protein